MIWSHRKNTKYGGKTAEQEKEFEDNDNGNDVELTREDIEFAKQNFQFYEKHKGPGSVVEVFELPMLLVCKFTP